MTRLAWGSTSTNIPGCLTNAGERKHRPCLLASLGGKLMNRNTTPHYHCHLLKALKSLTYLLMPVILMLALCPRMQCPISQMRTRVLVGLFINLTEVLATIRWQSQEVNMDSSVSKPHHLRWRHRALEECLKAGQVAQGLPRNGTALQVSRGMRLKTEIQKQKQCPL